MRDCDNSARVLYSLYGPVRSSNYKPSSEVTIMDNAVPTDSALRRHYEASHGKRPASSSSSQNKGGVFGWLKRIFGDLTSFYCSCA